MRPFLNFFLFQDIILLYYISIISNANSSPPAFSCSYSGVVGSGKLVESSYYKDPDGLTAYFSLTDQNGTSELPVIYKGEIGQIFFNEHSEIILQGKKQSNGIFLAETLTVKCPSKYLVEEELYDDSKL